MTVSDILLTGLSSMHLDFPIPSALNVYVTGVLAAVFNSLIPMTWLL